MYKYKNIVVCVTTQTTCEKLIQKGMEISESSDDKIYILHVVNENAKLLNKYSDGEALEYLFEKSKKLGGELIVERSKNITGTIVKFVKENAITHVVIGKSPDKENVVEKVLKGNFNKVEIIVI